MELGNLTQLRQQQQQQDTILEFAQHHHLEISDYYVSHNIAVSTTDRYLCR